MQHSKAKEADFEIMNLEGPAGCLKRRPYVAEVLHQGGKSAFCTYVAFSWGFTVRQF